MSGSIEKCFKTRIRWTIDGVTREKLEAPGFRLRSDSFSINFGDNETQWEAHVFQKNINFENHLRVGLNKIKALSDDFYLISHVKFVNIAKSPFTKSKASEFDKCLGWNIVSFDNLFDPCNNYLVNGSEMEFTFDFEIFYKEDENTDIDLMTSLLKRNTAYYSDAAFTDFILKSSDGEEFKVHRVFLAYESDFFMKLFTTDMEEKHKGSVQFEDIDSATLKEVVSYIYTLEANIDDVEKASKVIDAAEKFNLAGLKAICVKKLKEKVDKENAIEILVIADLYNENKLEKLCLKTIVENYAAVKRSDAWKLLTFPLLLKITDASNTAHNNITSTI